MLPEDKNRPGMVLTRDDQLLLVQLYKHRYLQTDQIYRLFPERSQQGLRRRLRLLHQHGFVERLDRSVRLVITAPHAYCLAKAGLEVVADQYAVTPEKLYTSHKGAQVRALYLAHYIGINDIWITVEQALATHPHLAMGDWLSEYTLKDPLAPITDRHRRFLLKQKLKGPHSKSYTWEPDSVFFAYRRDQSAAQQVMFAVEMDRGTMPLTRNSRGTNIRDKAIGHQLFVQRGQYKQLGAVAVRVLFVLESRRRLANMRAALADLSQPRFLFAVAEELSPTNFFSEPIWTAQDGQRKALYQHRSEARTNR